MSLLDIRNKEDYLESWKRSIVPKQAKQLYATVFGDVFFLISRTENEGLSDSVENNFNDQIGSDKHIICFLDTFRGIAFETNISLEILEKEYESNLMEPNSSRQLDELLVFPSLDIDIDLVLKNISQGKILSPTQPGFIGGSDSDANNFTNFLPIEIHLDVSGSIYEQIKDLPDGTPIDNFELYPSTD